MVHEGYGDPFTEFKAAHEDYRVYDAHYESIGKADEIFVDEVDEPLYIGVKTGLLDARSVLVPLEIIRINDKRQVVEIAAEADQIRHAPSLGDGEDLTPDLESRVYSYFGLASPLAAEPEYRDAPPSEVILEEELADDARVDVEPGERQETTRGTEPPHPGRPAGASRDVPPERLEQVSPPREPGKEWARGTERLPAEDGASDTPPDARLVRVRRLRR